MEKKKISAKEALADIHSGMSDSALMSKYLLSSAGLQSLFDKLVTAGYLDLAEIQKRTWGFLGTVAISETIPPVAIGKAEDGGQQFKSKSATQVNAQEVARDIRSGMDDSTLMEKYRLSPKGLQSLFTKLMAVNLIQQIDLDRRHFAADHTVALAEDMLSLSEVRAVLGSPPPTVAMDKRPLRPPRMEPAALPVDTIKYEKLPPEKQDAGPQQIKLDRKAIEHPWYDNPSVVIILLILLFPLGLYACYRNSSLPTGTKALAIVAWIVVVIALLVLVSTEFDWTFPRLL